jgi:hypothetical protein
VNDKNVDEDYAIRDGDRIVHETVREETPVIDSPVEVIKESA